MNLNAKPLLVMEHFYTEGYFPSVKDLGRISTTAYYLLTVTFIRRKLYNSIAASQKKLTSS